MSYNFRQFSAFECLISFVIPSFPWTIHASTESRSFSIVFDSLTLKTQTPGMDAQFRLFITQSSFKDYFFSKRDWFTTPNWPDLKLNIVLNRIWSFQSFYSGFSFLKDMASDKKKIDPSDYLISSIISLVAKHLIYFIVLSSIIIHTSSLSYPNWLLSRPVNIQIFVVVLVTIFHLIYILSASSNQLVPSSILNQ